MTYCAAVGDHVNAALAPGLEALRWHLLDHHYSDHATGLICRYVAAERTLAGAPGLESEDEATAEAAFVGALPDVWYGDPSWGIAIDHAAADAAERRIFDLAVRPAPIHGGAPEPADDDMDFPPSRPAPAAAKRFDSALDPATLGRIRAALWGL